MFELDLDQIEDIRSGIPAGAHEFTITKAELVETKSKKGLMYKLEFRAESGLRHWENYNIQNESEQAQKIGRGQFKALLTAAKYPESKVSDVNKLIGLKFIGVIKINNDEKYGEQRSFSSYKPSKGASIAAGSDPFI